MVGLGLGLGLRFAGGLGAQATGKPVNTAAPTITGIQTQAQTLGGDNGSWNQPVTGYAYKWQSSPDGSTWTDISGATSATYQPVAGDVGKYLRRGVLASNGFGAAVAGYAFSAATSGVIAAPLSISGSPGSSATIGSAYSFTPTTGGGHTPKTFAIIGKPAWAAFSTSTGQLTGTPSVGGVDANITISVTDADGLTAFLPSFTITTPSAGSALFDFNFAAGTYSANGTSYGSLAAVPGMSLSTPNAYAFNADGSMTLVAANAGRVGTMGLLVEQASANLIHDTAGLTTDWTNAGTITKNYGPSPLGSTSGFRDNSGSFKQYNASGGGSNDYAVSAWLKSNTGSDQSNLAFWMGANASVTATAAGGFVSGSGHFSGAGWDLYPVTSTIDVTADCVQLEAGQLFSTSFIPNPGTSPASRAADNISYSVLSPTGAFEIDFGFTTTRAIGQARTLFDWNDGSDSNKITVGVNASNQVTASVIVGGTTVSGTESGSPAAARTVTGQLIWDGSTGWTLKLGGSTVATFTSGCPTGVALQIGNNRAMGQAFNDVTTSVKVPGSGGGSSIVDVTSASQLSTLISAGVGTIGGKTLRLAASTDFGHVAFSGDFRSNPITIQGQTGSVFSWIEVTDCYGVTFKDFNCYDRGSPASIYVHDANDNLVFDGVRADSGLPQGQNLDDGFYFANVPATNIQVVGARDSATPDIWGHGAGVAIRKSTGITLKDLTFANTAVDHISLQGARNIVIDGCLGYDSFYGTGDHPDFIEGFSADGVNCDSILIQNCGWQRSTGMDSQFIFLAGVTNLTAQNNWCFGTSTNSIMIGADGATGASDHVTLTNNFCQGMTDLGSSITIRGATSNATLTSNLAQAIGTLVGDGPYAGYSETGSTLISNVANGNYAALDVWLAANTSARARV